MLHEICCARAAKSLKLSLILFIPIVSNTVLNLVFSIGKIQMFCSMRYNHSEQICIFSSLFCNMGVPYFFGYKTEYFPSKTVSKI